MPYTREISRSHPTAILYLIDQSSSMGSPFGSESISKAAKVAEIVNRHLYTLTMRCNRADGIRDYIYVGVIGYGAHVAPAFSGPLQGDLLPLSMVAQHPIRVEERTETISTSSETYSRKSHVPIWIEPVSDNGTPMAAAFSRVETILSAWLKDHYDCFPPTVFNITDSEFNEGGDPAPVAARIRNMSTSDGGTLIFNICITSNPAPPVLFPHDENDLPSSWDKLMYNMSSPLPQYVKDNSNDDGLVIGTNARCFVLNANAEAVLKALNLGTVAV